MSLNETIENHFKTLDDINWELKGTSTLNGHSRLVEGPWNLFLYNVSPNEPLTDIFQLNQFLETLIPKNLIPTFKETFTETQNIARLKFEEKTNIYSYKNPDQYINKVVIRVYKNLSDMEDFGSIPLPNYLT